MAAAPWSYSLIDLFEGSVCTHSVLFISLKPSPSGYANHCYQRLAWPLHYTIWKSILSCLSKLPASNWQVTTPWRATSCTSGVWHCLCFVFLPALFCFSVWGRVLLCSLGWLLTHDLPVSASNVLKPQACANTPRFFIFLLGILIHSDSLESICLCLSTVSLNFVSIKCVSLSVDSLTESYRVDDAIISLAFKMGYGFWLLLTVDFSHTLIMNFLIHFSYDFHISMLRSLLDIGLKCLIKISNLFPTEKYWLPPCCPVFI